MSTATDLLARIPATWHEYNAADLTAAEGDALRQLVGAGLVERRMRVRVSILNASSAMEATIIATGEYGIAEALEQFVAAGWCQWREQYQQWQEGESDAVPFHAERVLPDEWRLTAQGAQAQADAAAGDDRLVTEFCGKRGFFRRRPPVRGAGLLENLDRPAAEPARTAVANWEEGAKVFATAFAAMQATGADRSDRVGDVAAILDEHAGKVATIAADTDKSLDERMRLIAILKPESTQWKSDRWGELLGVTDGRIRQQPSWKNWRKCERK